MVPFPHGVMGGTGEVDKYLLWRAEIGVELPHTIGVDLCVVGAGNQEHWDLHFGHQGRCPTPHGHPGCAPDTASPRSAHRVRKDHFGPDRVAGSDFVLAGTTDFA